MTRARLSRILLRALLGLVLAGGILLAGLYAALHSPRVLNLIAHGFGYDLAVGRIALSPPFSASLSEVKLLRLADDRLLLTATSVTARSPLEMVLRGEVDTLVLQDPKFTYRVDGGAAAGTRRSRAGGWSPPRIRSLDIRNAQALITFAGKPGQVALTAANLRVRNLAPGTRGTAAFDAEYAVLLEEPQARATGRVKGTLQLEDVAPTPRGTGSLELTADSGSHAVGGGRVSLTGLTLAADVQYDQSQTFTLSRLRGNSRELGAIEGSARVTLRGETPWQARLSVTEVEFAQAFRVLQPFLPADYQGWTLQGRGAVETDLQGTYADGRPSFSGQVGFAFTRGGFSSPDGATAAQGMAGRLILKLRYAPADEKLAFELRSQGGGGEYLRGTYYNDFTGRTVSLESEGAVFLGARRYRASGTLDLFQTGAYRFHATGDAAESTLRLDAQGVSHARLLDVLLGEHLKTRSPGLGDLSVSGTSSLEATVRRRGGTTTIAGTYRVLDATLDAPAMSLAVRDLAMEVPFDLAYPSPDPAGARPGPPGHLSVRAVRWAPLEVADLRVPVIVAGNALEVPEAVTLPVLGGAIHLYGLRIDDLLSPARYQFGVKIDGVDLGELTRRVVGTEYAGTVYADLGSMTYEGGRVASEGRAAIIVFGGEIEVRNFFAENLWSASRKLGGDVVFERIDLEQVTSRIALGKVTGIIRGSLTGVVMEFGQPARFVLEVESVPVRGVPQRISTEAIQSISVLGTGAEGALNRGITRLFREYPYSEIGFRCVLHNDRFTVRGTIHEGGKEYLVRRGLLRGVDVVNQNPENVISFRDMQERLQRITRPAQVEPGGIRVQ
jgi:hypothetical protein